MLPEKITFITSQQLLEMYPDMDDKERERNIAYKYKAVHFDWFPFPTSKKFHDIKKSISFNLVEGTINELGKLIIDKAIDVLKPRFILSVGLDSWNYFTKYANPRKFLTSIVTVGSKDYKSMSLIYSTGNTKVCVYGSDLYYPNPNTPESCSFKDWLPLFEEFEKNRLYFSCHPMSKSGKITAILKPILSERKSRQKADFLTSLPKGFIVVKP